MTSVLLPLDEMRSLSSQSSPVSRSSSLSSQPRSRPAAPGPRKLSQSNDSSTLPMAASRRAQRSSTKNLDPLMLARYQCEVIDEHIRKRASIQKTNPQRAANLVRERKTVVSRHLSSCIILTSKPQVLEAEKKKIEIIEMAKRKKSRLDDQLVERQQQLKDLAAEKVLSLKSPDPTREQQVLTAILLHDNQDVSVST